MKKLLFILCSILLLPSCSKDDDEVSESDKMYYKTTTRFSWVVELEDKNQQKKHIRIMDVNPGNRNPWAYDAYCPNPVHKGATGPMYQLSFDPTIDYAIFCKLCGIAYHNNGKPYNNETEKSKIRIHFYNIIYDESISSYVIWE